MTPSVPSIWRIELLHPAVAHFPVALLVAGGTLSALAWLPPVRRRMGWLRDAALLNLVLGTLGAGAALLTGEEAEDVVNRVICDPEATQLHEQLAQATLGTAIAAIIVLVLARKWPKVELPGVVLALGAAALVGLTGHRGAELVYQQGAAVYHPSAGCEEFQ